MLLLECLDVSGVADELGAADGEEAMKDQLRAVRPAWAAHWAACLTAKRMACVVLTLAGTACGSLADW